MKLLHVIGAVIALMAGTVSLVAGKGSRVHRTSGMVFVYSMLLMSSTGAVMGALEPNLGNVMAGVLTFYLVLTARLTVRRPVLEFQRIDALAMLMALAVTIGAFKFGFEAIASGGKLRGIPAPVFFMFGTVALLATLGDVRVMVARRIEGAPRLARHLWRMCFAFWIATASFFLGPPRRLPPLLRHSPLRPLPVLLVLLVMFYWLARVSLQRRRGHAWSPLPAQSMRTKA
jgi:uncharacterized membrane protein